MSASRFLRAAALAAMTVASAHPKERPGVVEMVDRPGNDAVADQLFDDERHMDNLERLAGALETCAATRGPMEPETLRRLYRLGRVAYEAEDTLAREIFPGLVVAARATLREDDSLRFEILQRAVGVSRRAGNRSAARALLTEARATLARVPGPKLNLELYLRSAEAGLSPRRPLPEQIEILRDEATLAARHVQGPGMSDASNATWRSVFLGQLGRDAESMAAAREARRMLAEVGAAHGYLDIVLDDRDAERAALDGRWEEADDLARRLAIRSEDYRDRFAVGPMSRRTFAPSGYPILALHAVRTGQGDAAWRYLERWRAPHAVDMSMLGAWPDRDAAAWAVYRSAQAGLLEARDRAVEVGFAWSPATWRTTMAWIRARLRVLRLETDYLRRSVPREPSIEEARRALGPRDAMVGWLEVNLGGDPGPSQLPHRMYRWGYVLRPDRPIAWVELLPGVTWKEVQQTDGAWGGVFAVFDRASRWPGRVDLDPELRAQLHAWSKSYFHPLMPHLQGVERIVFAELRYPVNLHSLPDGSYVGEHFDVAMTASGQALTVSPRAGMPLRRARATAALLYPTSAARATVLPVSGPRGIRAPAARADGGASTLADLHYVGGEIRSVASRFGRVMKLTGTLDSIHRLNTIVRSDGMRHFDVVHVAAHTLSSPDPERCAFSLSGAAGGSTRRSDAVLDAEEIFRGWRIDPDLLTLSGCDTGVAAGVGGREAFGFIPIVAAIGGHRVLASVRPVDDEATALLHEALLPSYTGRAAPSPERALREAPGLRAELSRSRRTAPLRAPDLLGALPRIRAALRGFQNGIHPQGQARSCPWARRARRHARGRRSRRSEPVVHDEPDLVPLHRVARPELPPGPQAQRPALGERQARFRPRTVVAVARASVSGLPPRCSFSCQVAKPLTPTSPALPQHAGPRPSRSPDHRPARSPVSSLLELLLDAGDGGKAPASPVRSRVPRPTDRVHERPVPATSVLRGAGLEVAGGRPEA